VNPEDPLPTERQPSSAKVSGQTTVHDKEKMPVATQQQRFCHLSIVVHGDNSDLRQWLRQFSLRRRQAEA
jgi:hypothetical protein